MRFFSSQFPPFMTLVVALIMMSAFLYVFRLCRTYRLELNRSGSGAWAAGFFCLFALVLMTTVFFFDADELPSWLMPAGALLNLAIGMGLLLKLLSTLAQRLQQTTETPVQDTPPAPDSRAADFLSSSARLSGLLAAMENGVLVCDKQGEILFSNAGASKMFGLASDQTRLIYDEQSVRFFREDGSALAQTDLPVWKTLASAEPQHNVLLGCKYGDQALSWLQLSTSVIFSGQDPAQLEYVLISATDVSSLKLSENHLREREAVLATVFQLVPATLTITRMSDGHYIDVNRNWEPLSGFSRDEALGRTSSELQIWGAPEQRMQMVEQIVNNGEVHNMIIAFRHKLGHIFQCRVSGSKFDAGDGRYLLLSVQNIDQEIATENAKNQAETLLRESQRKYWSIFQLSPIPLGLVKISDSSMLEVNDSWVLQFGYAREEVLGHTTLDINLWCDPLQRQEMLRQIILHEQVDRFEAHIRSKSGDMLTCLVSARSFAMNGDDMFIFSMLDVTRQYQVEKEIREMTAELELRVSQRTLKLEQANAELANAMGTLQHAKDELVRSEKMAALGALVAGIAHELNTPIGNSVTVASTLQDKTRELLRDMADGQLRRSMLDQYLNSVAAGTGILMRSLGSARDLIGSFKQVAVDQSSSQRRHFDLKTLLEEIIATLSPMYKKGPYTLVMELAPDIVMDSFPGPLGQIITNFMTNALNHAFEGREQGEIRISSTLASDGQAELIFSDNGVGISEADQKRVFDPFFTTKLGQGGSGLGMNIVYNITTGVLGGTIRIDTQLGRGTRFIVRLPTSAPALLSETDMLKK